VSDNLKGSISSFNCFSLTSLNPNALNKNTETLADASNDVGLEANEENQVNVDVSSPERGEKS
jgi:hypothetical protein